MWCGYQTFWLNHFSSVFFFVFASLRYIYFGCSYRLTLWRVQARDLLFASVEKLLLMHWRCIGVVMKMMMMMLLLLVENCQRNKNDIRARYRTAMGAIRIITAYFHKSMQKTNTRIANFQGGLLNELSGQPYSICVNRCYTTENLQAKKIIAHKKSV